MLKRRVYAIAISIFLTACGAPQAAPGDEDVSENQEIPYLELSSFEAEVLGSDIPVLIDFTAEWCAPCRIVDPVIDSLMPEMQGRAKVYKVDIDEEPELYNRLGVNGVPHILLFSEGSEQERISAPQEREIYIEYLEALIDGRSTLKISLKLLQSDDFRRHFILSRRVSDLEDALRARPTLLTDPFENGQSPLALVLNKPSYFQNELVELIMRQSPVLTPKDLVGLGRCEEFLRALADEPSALDQRDPDGVSVISLALRRSSKLNGAGCEKEVVAAGPDLSEDRTEELPLGRMAVMLDDAELLEAMLDLGLNAETVNGVGRTMLHWAVNYGNVAAVEQLLARSANKNHRTMTGQTPLDIALAAKARLRKAISEQGSTDDQRSRLEKLEAIILLLEKPT